MQKTRLFRFITLVIACLMLLGSSQPAITAPNQTTLVSVASDGEQGNQTSRYPAISEDGRFVAFHSRATNMVVGDTNGYRDVFVHDRQTGETTRVSVGPGGVEGNGDSYNPAISADGRFVAFYSYATNLVADDTNGHRDIFVHDRTTKITTLVSYNSTSGEQGDSRSSSPAISADGRFVAFRSEATNLVAGDTNKESDIFVHDRTTKITTRVSVGPSLVEGNGGSYSPAISADGRFVAFESWASNLVTEEDNNIAPDIFVHDRHTDETTRVSVGPGGVEGNNESYSPAISADGRFVAFISLATNLVALDTNGFEDIFVHDRTTKITTRVSVGPGGVEANGNSYNPAISADGRFVAFRSKATNLVDDDTNGFDDIFVHNRLTGETTRVSVDSAGVEGNGASSQPAISADGRYVAFQSYASNLVAGDDNLRDDIFVRGLPYPEVTVEQAAGQPDPTGDTQINFTATFTKPIDPAIFDGGDVLLGGTAGATTAVVTEVAPNNGTTFNIAVSGMTGHGTVTASIPYGVVEDMEGYVNAASTSTKNEVTYLWANFLPMMFR